MAEFYESTLWMKLTMMLISGAFSMHLFAMDAPGWGQYTNMNCNVLYSGGICANLNAVRAVQALEVIGFLSVLTALFLSLCLVLLDELKGNKLALVCLTVFSLIAGVAIIIGIAVFEGTTSSMRYGIDGAEYGISIGVMAGVCALMGGVFCILELGGVCIRYDDHGHRHNDDLGHRNDHGHRNSDDLGHRNSDDLGHRNKDDYGHRKNEDPGHRNDDHGRRNKDDHSHRNDDDHDHRKNEDHGHRNDDRERATVH